MKIRSLLSMAFAMLCLTSAMAQSKTVTTTSAGTLAGLLTDDEKATVKELTISGPLNKTDFNFITSLAALETLDIKATTIVEETLEGKTYPADELPESALASNKIIKTLILPASVISIGKNAVDYTAVANVDFSSCTKLKTIADQAIYRNDYLNSINLAGLKALETIGENAFGTCCAKTTGTPFIDLSGCSALKKISDYGFANIKNAGVTINLSGCTSLISIGDGGFQNTKAKNIDLSECSALESIGKRAYSAAAAASSAITTAKLPANLKTITTEAFRNQKKLTSVTCLAAVPPTLGKDAFFPTDGAYNATLTVPVGSKAAYEANEEWKKFKEIVESDGSSVKEFEVANLKVWTAGDAVCVAGAEEGTVVNVYDISGAPVASATVSAGSATLPLSAKGLYIVKAGEATAKVRL